MVPAPPVTDLAPVDVRTTVPTCVLETTLPKFMPSPVAVMERGLYIVTDALAVASTTPINEPTESCAIAGLETRPTLNSKPKNFNV